MPEILQEMCWLCDSCENRANLMSFISSVTIPRQEYFTRQIHQNELLILV